MEHQRPNLLYSGEPNTDLINLLEYIDEVYHNLGINPFQIDIEAMRRVIISMYRDFPFQMGIEEASPFKKVAAFTVNFVKQRPIMSHLPHSRVGDLADHQNEILAFDVSRDALFGAKITCPRRGELVLEKRIIISLHYWRDLIAALSTVTDGDVNHVALIYEALVYNLNPNISYERVI